MSGYTQAIENLAYVIDQLTMQTIDPIFRQHGPAAMANPQQFMSEEDLQMWDEFDNVAMAVSDTYEVDYNEMMDDVESCYRANILAKSLGTQ